MDSNAVIRTYPDLESVSMPPPRSLLESGVVLLPIQAVSPWSSQVARHRESFMNV